MGLAGVVYRQVHNLTIGEIRAAVGEDTVDAIVHLAAAGVSPADRDVPTLAHVNTVLPGQLVTLANDLGARAVLLSGSNAEYARNGEAQIDESGALETSRLYGTTKAAGGLLAVASGIACDVTAVNLRLFNVFGPGESEHRLLPSLIGALRAGQDVPLSAGQQVRDFVHVDDACRAIVAAMRSALDGSLKSGHYNVCTGEGHSVREFASQVAISLNVPVSRLAFGALPLRPDDLPHVVGNPNALMSRIRWQPARSFADSIAHAVAEIINPESVQGHV
jgi:GDP-4-dehydro-6-deoxy-D-mannose reductase